MFRPFRRHRPGLRPRKGRAWTMLPRQDGSELWPWQQEPAAEPKSRSRRGRLPRLRHHRPPS